MCPQAAPRLSEYLLLPLEDKEDIGLCQPALPSVAVIPFMLFKVFLNPLGSAMTP